GERIRVNREFGECGPRPGMRRPNKGVDSRPLCQRVRRRYPAEGFGQENRDSISLRYGCNQIPGPPAAIRAQLASKSILAAVSRQLVKKKVIRPWMHFSGVRYRVRPYI